MLPKPRTPAPALTAERLEGGTWSLADEEGWKMVVFYRGFHCPVCQAYLRQLDREVENFESIGVQVIPISGDTRERAEQTKSEWKLENLDLGYGLSFESMQEWGLFISKGMKEGEPDVFSEPGLFVIKPDNTVFYVAVNSMTFGRPRMSEIHQALEMMVPNDAPARGEV